MAKRAHEWEGATEEDLEVYRGYKIVKCKGWGRVWFEIDSKRGKRLSTSVGARMFGQADVAKRFIDSKEA